MSMISELVNKLRFYEAGCKGAEFKKVLGEAASTIEECMRIYQCSKCEHLQDYDEYCACDVGIDPRPNHRGKHDAKQCRESFKPLPSEKQWHEKFGWE